MEQSSLHAVGQHLAELARTVGEQVRALQGHARIAEKGPADLVTEADQLSHRLITAELSARYPGLALVMEEQENAARVPEHCIVVDELDGTHVYCHGADDYALTLALIESGRPVVGVMHQPVKQQTVIAVRGHGAFLNGVRLALDPAARLADHIAMFEINRNVPERGRQHMFALADHSLGVRCLGTAVGSAIELLRGRVCLYVNWRGAKIWDFAAASLAIEEAGGVALSCLGEALRWDHVPMGVLLAANQDVASAAISCSAD